MLSTVIPVRTVSTIALLRVLNHTCLDINDCHHHGLVTTDIHPWAVVCARLHQGCDRRYVFRP